jgi:hypothetical protein
MELRSTIVMAGLDPAIQKKELDHRGKPGDDKGRRFHQSQTCPKPLQ